MPYSFRTGEARALVPPPPRDRCSPPTVIPLFWERHFNGSYRRFHRLGKSKTKRGSFLRSQASSFFASGKYTSHDVGKKKVPFKGRPFPSCNNGRPEGMSSLRLVQGERKVGGRRKIFRNTFDCGIGRGRYSGFERTTRFSGCSDGGKEFSTAPAGDNNFRPADELYASPQTSMNVDRFGHHQPLVTANADPVKLTMKESNGSPLVNAFTLGYAGVLSQRDTVRKDGSDQMPEMRVDRYGKSASVKRFFQDVQTTGHDLSESLERKLLGGSVTDEGEDSDVSACNGLREPKRFRLHNVLDVPTSSSSPQNPSPSNIDGHGAECDGVGRPTPKKRPRLGWGQGLAQYEKRKVVGTDGSTMTLKIDISSSEAHNGRLLNSFMVENNSALSISSPIGTATTNSLADSLVHNVQIEGGAPLLASSLLHFSEDAGSSLDTAFRKGLLLSEKECGSVLISPAQNISAIWSKCDIFQHLEKIEHEIDLVEKELGRFDCDEQSSEECCGIIQQQLDIQSRAQLVNGDGDLCAAVSNGSCETFNIAGSNGERFADTSVKTFEGHILFIDSPNHSKQPVLNERENFTQGRHAFDTRDGEQGVLGVQDNELDRLCLNQSFSYDSQIQTDQRNVCELLKANKERSKEAIELLAHLLPDSCTAGNGRVLYYKPTDSPFWKRNVESHQLLKRCLVERILVQQQALTFKERVLASKYRILREIWRKELSFMRQRRDRHKRLRSLRSGLTPIYFTSEEFNTRQGYMAGGLQQICQKTYLKMPAMILDDKSFLSFSNKNGLIADPVATEKERSIINPWTPEEKRTFYEKFMMFNKNFKRIALFLERKTVADCIQFYYKNQKSDEFEKFRQTRRRRDYSVRSSYLASTAVRNSRYYELNAICIEQLPKIVTTPKEFSETTKLIFKKETEPSKSFESHLSGSIDEHKVASIEAVSPCQSSATALSVNCWDQEQSKHGFMLYPRVSSTIVDHPVEAEESKAMIVRRESAKVNDDVLNSQWSDTERQLFIAAISMFGKDFKNIAQHVGSKNQDQCKAFFSKTRRRLQLDVLLAKCQLNGPEVVMPKAEDLKVASVADEFHPEEEPILDVEATRMLDGSRTTIENLRRLDKVGVEGTSTVEVHLFETEASTKVEDMSGLKAYAVTQTVKTEKHECESSTGWEPAIEIDTDIFKQELKAEPSDVTAEVDSRAEEEVQANNKGLSKGLGMRGDLATILQDHVQPGSLDTCGVTCRSEWKNLPFMHADISISGGTCSTLILPHKTMEIIADSGCDDKSRSEPTSRSQDQENNTESTAGYNNLRQITVEECHSNGLLDLTAFANTTFEVTGVDQSDTVETTETVQQSENCRVDLLSNVVCPEANHFVSRTSSLNEGAISNVMEEPAGEKPSGMSVEVPAVKRKRGNKARGSTTRRGASKRRVHPATSKFSSSHQQYSNAQHPPHMSSDNLLQSLTPQQQKMLVQQAVILHQQQLQAAFPLQPFTQTAFSLQHDQTAEQVARSRQLENQMFHYQHQQQQQRLMAQKQNQYRQATQHLQERGIQSPLYLQKVAEAASYQQMIHQQELFDQQWLVSEQRAAIQNLQQVVHLQDSLTHQISQQKQRLAAKNQELVTHQSTEQDEQIVHAQRLQKIQGHPGYASQNQPAFPVQLQQQQHKQQLENQGRVYDPQFHHDQVGNMTTLTSTENSQMSRQQLSRKTNIGSEFVENATGQRTGTGDVKLFGRPLFSCSSPRGIQSGMKDSGVSFSGYHSLPASKQDHFLSKYDEWEQEAQSVEDTGACATEHLARHSKAVENVNMGEARLVPYSLKHIELLLGAQDHASNDTLSRVVHELDCDSGASGGIPLLHSRDWSQLDGQSKQDYLHALRGNNLWAASNRSNIRDFDVLASSSHGAERVSLQNQSYSGSLHHGSWGDLFHREFSRFRS